MKIILTILRKGFLAVGLTDIPGGLPSQTSWILRLRWPWSSEWESSWRGKWVREPSFSWTLLSRVPSSRLWQQTVFDAKSLTKKLLKTTMKWQQDIILYIHFLDLETLCWQTWFLLKESRITDRLFSVKLKRIMCVCVCVCVFYQFSRWVSTVKTRQHHEHQDYTLIWQSRVVVKLCSKR